MKRTINIANVLLLTSTLLYSGCGGSGGTNGTANISLDSVTTGMEAKVEPIPDLVLAKVETGEVLKALFLGTPGPDGKSIDWSTAGEQGETGNRTRVSKILTFGANKGRKVVVLETEGLMEGKAVPCRSCAPILGLAMFMKEADGWRLKGLAKNLGDYGGNGRMGPTKLLQAGPDRHLFQIWAAYGMGGQEIEAVFWFSLAEEDSRIQRVFDAHTLEQYDNPKTGVTSGQRTTFEFTGSGPSFDDIKATSKQFGDKSGTEVTTYRFDTVSGTYKLVKSH